MSFNLGGSNAYKAGCTTQVLTSISSTPFAATTPNSEKPGKSTVAKAPKISTEAPPAVSTAMNDAPMPTLMDSIKGLPFLRSSAMREDVNMP